MKTLESLRHKLNKNAELSGQEKKTNKIINEFLAKTNPDVHLRNVGAMALSPSTKEKIPARTFYCAPISTD